MHEGDSSVNVLAQVTIYLPGNREHVRVLQDYVTHRIGGKFAKIR